MFIVYSIVPAFVVACLGLFIFILVWRYTIVHYNQEDNQYIGSRVTEVVQGSEGEMERIAEGLNLQKPLTAEEKAYALRSAYQVAKTTGCKGNLYLLNTGGTVLISSTNEIPEYLVNPEYQNWGILRKLKEIQDEGIVKEGLEVKTSQYVISLEENGQNLCIGTDIKNGDTTLGYLIIVIPQQEIQQLMSGISRQFMVTNEKGWSYLYNYGTMLDEMGRVALQIQHQNGFVRFEDHQYFISSNPIIHGALYVYAVTDTEPRANMIILIVSIVLLIFLALGLITYFSTEKMADKNTQDIDTIAHAFSQMEKGDFNTYLAINSSEEFETIGNAYNLMLDSLKTHISENKELAEHVAFAQVKQLESQFNPHFLFNTLDNIRFMTKIDVDQADKMIIALSKLLRYSISDAREETTVAEDMMNMQNYLTIVKIRFNKRFTYDIDIEEGVEKCLIPKLMVQPLIENAIKYGFTGRENLHVHIRGYEKHDKLIFICEDDGAGIDQTLLKEIQDNLKNSQNATSHMGLYNIHRRIRLLYKEDYGVKIQSEPEKGTTVVLVLPMRR